MPHKSYHGKTGRVFNVSKRAVGVVVNKRVRGKILPKRVYVRVEHVKHSQCRKDFLDRGEVSKENLDEENSSVKHSVQIIHSFYFPVHANEVRKTEAKASGKKGAPCKRFPVEPKTAHMVSTKDNEPQFLAPIPYEFMA